MPADPITGLPFGAPGTTGSGRQSGVVPKIELLGKDEKIINPQGQRQTHRQTPGGAGVPLPPSTGIQDPFATASSPFAVGFDQPPRAQTLDLSNTAAGEEVGGGGLSGGLFQQPGVGAGVTDPATGQTIDPATGQTVGDPGTEFDDVSEFGLDPADPNSNGLISPGAQGLLDQLQLDGSVDSNAISNWLNGLISSGSQVTDVRPDGQGGFIATGTDSFGEAQIWSIPAELAQLDAREQQQTDISALEAQLSADRLALDTELGREQLRIQEEISRIDQDIARDRIQADQEISSGNWQNALDIQNRIDERERSQRQLDRDLFNANQELQNRRFELDRASFDLEKTAFFQSLSRSPANFADLFNLSRGQAPVGAGGPLPQGIQRVAPLSDVQQTAAQDFRMNGIDLGVNANTGALPQVGAEGARPEFQNADPSLSFAGGGDPTPVGPDGLPLGAGAPPPINPALDETGAGGEGGAPLPPPAAGGDAGVLASPTGLSAPQIQVPGAGFGNIGGSGETFGSDNVRQLGPEQTAQVEKARAAALAGGGASFTDPGPQMLSQAGINAPISQQVDQAQALQQGGAVEPPVEQTVDAVVQGAPLPPGLQVVFNGGLPGAPQTLPNSIPILSPQQLNQLTPSETEVYFALAEMQGQFGPDFQNIVASRGAPQEQTSNQRVFV